jgi:hypothetical protein
MPSLDSTTKFEKGLYACTSGTKLARCAFEEMARDMARRTTWAKQINFTGPCSAGVQKFDQYYMNPIILETKFWQSKPIRHFGKFIYEWYPGFFCNRWSDQMFFQLAMGMFIGPGFQDYVMDYTKL